MGDEGERCLSLIPANKMEYDVVNRHPGLILLLTSEDLDQGYTLGNRPTMFSRTHTFLIITC